MSSTFYTPAQVIQFFPEAWTVFQAKNNSEFRAKCIKEYAQLLEKQNRVSEAKSLKSQK
jgi:hypothetical protein